MPSKEHSGGVYNGLFKVPAEWCDDHRTAVKIEHFDHESLDSIDDLVREELELKGTVKALFKKMVAFEVHRARSETAVAILAHIIQAKDAGLEAVKLSFASGMMLTADMTEEEAAKQFGISKQAFQQGVDRISEQFGLRKTRTMRDKAARELMRLANFRPK